MMRRLKTRPEIRRLARRVGELMLLLGEHGIALPEKKH